MNFLSLDFLAVFSLFLLLYWLPLHNNYSRNLLLTCASYAFVTLFDVRFAAILGGYSLLVYGLANHAGRWLRPLVVNCLLAVAIVALFITFKHYAFFRESIQHSLAAAGLQLDLPVLNLLLPIGLSYYSFHSVSYVVDCQKDARHRASLADVLLYLAFFPSLVAGPINRARHFMPQIQATERHLLEPKRALFLITLAIAKLFLFSAWLADNLVDPAFADVQAQSAASLLVAIYAYAWVIYCNFSGYTDLVTGIGLLLGFRLPVNFNAPYLARNLKEFWGRWHISLSTFIRDYIYIPLGGSRGGLVRTSLNVMVAMLLSGLWHGAGLTFVIWGALHGLGVVLLNIRHRLWSAAPYRFKAVQALENGLARLVCFHFICLTWVFFRSDSLDQAWQILLRLGNPALWQNGLAQGPALLAAAIIFIAYPALVSSKEKLEAASNQWRWGLYPVWLSLVLIGLFALSPSGMPNFIYAGF